MSFGIDFGSESSSAALCLAGSPRSVKESHRQQYSLPSSAFWDREAGVLLVGEAAEFARRRSPAAYVREFKRDLGKDLSSTLDGRPFRTEELVAGLLQQLTREAAAMIPDEKVPTRAVLTYPAHWEKHRQECLSQAARLARLEPVLLAEPIAAALYHEFIGRARWPDGERALVFHLGGGTFSCALLARQQNGFQEVVRSRGRDDVSGSAFDVKIFQDLLKSCPEDLRERLQRDRSEAGLRLRQAVWTECRALKHQLSQAPRASIKFDSLEGLAYTLEARQFEAMIRPDLEAALQECRRLLEEAGGASRAPRILLSGGSTRVPLVARLLQEAFGRKPEAPDDPELCISRGAALHAGRVCPDRDLDNPELATLVQAIEAEIEKARKKPFVFLLAGRTGVGKSSTINSLLGKTVAPVGDFEPTTMLVEEYPTTIGGIHFKVVDTPGLCDGKDAVGGNDAYLKLMAQKAPEVDSFWFVTPLNDTRVSSDEIRAIQMITDAFGPEIWKTAVIVFTFANAIDAKKKLTPEASLDYYFQNRTRLIREEIARCAGAPVAKAIPAVAVDNTAPVRLDGQPWKGELYTTVFDRLSKEGLAATTFYLATAHRLRVQKKEDERAAQERKQRQEQERQQAQQAQASKRERPARPEPEDEGITLTQSQHSHVRETVAKSIVDRCASVGRSLGNSVGLGGVGESIGRGVGKVLSWLGW